MTNGNGDRLDRIERILEQAAKRQEQFEEQAARRQEQYAEQAATWREQNEEQAARWREQYEEISKVQREMAARQQYHDEAFEWNDAEIKRILEAQAVDGEHIRALVRIAELHHLRLEGLEGGESA